MKRSRFKKQNGKPEWVAKSDNGTYRVTKALCGLYYLYYTPNGGEQEYIGWNKKLWESQERAVSHDKKLSNLLKPVRNTYRSNVPLDCVRDPYKN